MIAIANKPIPHKEGRWYVLIAKEPEGNYRWDAVFEDQYDFYERRFIIEKDFEIIAGPYSVDERTLDKITGCNADGQEIGEKHLEQMVRKLNFREEVDPVYELEKLING